MVQSKEFVDASHALDDLSHALALLESENASLRGAVDGLCNENAKLRELVRDMMRYYFMPSVIDSKRRETELFERAHKLGVKEDDDELGVEVN